MKRLRERILGSWCIKGTDESLPTGSTGCFDVPWLGEILDYWARSGSSQRNKQLINSLKIAVDVIKWVINSHCDSQ